MTYHLKTKSHGEITAGFTTPQIGMITLGKYAFTTKYFCEFIQNLADNSDLREGAISAYGLEKLLEETNKDLLDFYAKADEAINTNKPKKSVVIREIGQSQKKLLTSDKYDQSHEATMLIVKISEDARSITIGEYEIAALEFMLMADHVANGGWLGWRSIKPEFAEPTVKKMRESKNPLFAEYQKLFDKKDRLLFSGKRNGNKC